VGGAARRYTILGGHTEMLRRKDGKKKLLASLQQPADE
jgi:hypothetical protein